MSDDDIVRRIEHLLDARFQTLEAKLDTIDVRREHGDRQLEQSVTFLRSTVRDNTLGLAEMVAKVERVQHDQQAAIEALRKYTAGMVAESLEESMEKLKAGESSFNAASTQLGGRVATLERRWDRMTWTAGGLMLGAGGIGGFIASFIAQVAG